MQYTEREFYAFLLTLINKDLANKGLKPIDLLDKSLEYIISRTHYYNIKKVADGDEGAKSISHTLILSLCTYLNVDLKEVLYDVKE